MLAALKGLLSSKKFWLTIIGGGIVSGLTYAHAPESLILIISGLFGLNAVGQGLADVGKSKTLPQ